VLIPKSAGGDNIPSSTDKQPDRTSILVMVPTVHIKTLVAKVWPGAPTTVAATPATASRPDADNAGISTVIVAIARETELTPWMQLIRAWQRVGAVVRLARGDWLDWMASTNFDSHLEAIADALEGATPFDPTSMPIVPDMSITHRVTLPAPKLDSLAFGAPLAEWITSAAASKSTPVDYVAFSLLIAASGVVGAVRWAEVWENWVEPCVLWGVLVGAPSSAKSPAMDCARQPLADVEKEMLATWPDDQRCHEQDTTVAAAHREQWASEVRTAAQNGEPSPPMPPSAMAPPKPQMPRIVITDSTIERTAAILNGNPRGLLLWRDELSAWLGNLSKYGDGDRAFWLEAYGARPYTVDRQKLSEPLHIRHHAISILGSIQPDRLATLLLNGDDDGLASRFLFVWPDPLPPRRPSTKTDNAIVANALRRLRTLDSRLADEDEEVCSVALPIEQSALVAFQQWREQHYIASQLQSGFIASAYGKMPGLSIRIALTLELLQWAAGPIGDPAPQIVSAKSLGAALNLVETYIKPMLARVYGDAALPLIDQNAATLARAILRRRVDRINATEIRRSWKLPGLREAPAVKSAIEALVDAGWLFSAGTRAGETTGRLRSDWAVNSAIYDDGSISAGKSA
jgi:Protein of unknown function (DUF3987)